jgi:hypothetical protein
MFFDSLLERTRGTIIEVCGLKSNDVEPGWHDFFDPSTRSPLTKMGLRCGAPSLMAVRLAVDREGSGGAVSEPHQKRTPPSLVG